MTIVAAVQMASGPNINANLCEAERLIAKSAAAGAKLVVLPENFALMGHQESDKLPVREAEGEGPLQTFLARQADRNNIFIPKRAALSGFEIKLVRVGKWFALNILQ